MTTIPALPAPSGNQTIEDRRTISQRFIQHAREELAKGNRLQAGEKAWGAVAQYLKIIGDNRGWRHTSHRHMEYIARQILDEYPDYDTGNLAHALSDVYDNGHRNFYENHATDEEIAELVDDTESLVLPVFETLVSLPPRPVRITSGRSADAIEGAHREPGIGGRRRISRGFLYSASATGQWRQRW